MNHKDLEKLKTELNFFNSKKAEWLLVYEDKYALIKGQVLVETFTTLDEAYVAGVMKFGTDPFLVKQIVKNEPPEELTSHFANVINVRF
jgi:hypothetical protein